MTKQCENLLSNTQQNNMESTKRFIIIKSEVHLSEWYLIAVSEAAKKRRGLIRLNIGSNTFGRATSNDFKFSTVLLSKTQCCIDVSDADVILTDLVCMRWLFRTKHSG